jgi:hypothetical protein
VAGLLHRPQRHGQAPLVGVAAPAAGLPAGQQAPQHGRMLVMHLALARGERQQALAVHHRRQLVGHVGAQPLQHAA